MINDILLWWAGQMCACVPAHLLPATSAADALIVTADGFRDSLQIRLALRRAGREKGPGPNRMVLQPSFQRGSTPPSFPKGRVGPAALPR
jgi:hypothetical protein